MTRTEATYTAEFNAGLCNKCQIHVMQFPPCTHNAFFSCNVMTLFYVIKTTCNVTQQVASTKDKI